VARTTGGVTKTYKGGFDMKSLQGKALRVHTTPAIVRKLERIAVAENGCWEWTGTRNKYGYGVVSFWSKEKDEKKLAHRLMYALTIGPLEADVQVCHRCDNPCCVNPSHLFLGTQADNMNDMTCKGRRYYPPSKGEHNGRAKLTQAKADEIRRRYANRDRRESVEALRQEFGIAQTTFYHILNNDTWKPAPAPTT
jgi:hypothetical protein